MNKLAYKQCYKHSFQLSTAFLVDWVEHFRNEEAMPTVVAYIAQLRLRGVTL